jgi:hypothetical protein
MSRRGCRKVRKETMLRIWRIEQSLKQRPELERPSGHPFPNAVTTRASATETSV